MKNRPKENEETTAKRKPKRGLARWMQQLLSGDFLARENVVRHIPFILYLCFFFLLSIYIGHVFENTERQKIRIERELEELSAEYKTLKSELEAQRQQSSVAERIRDLGLEEPSRPPVIIEPNTKNKQ